jgi:hypothetical protein
MHPAKTSGAAAQNERNIQQLEFMGRIPCERRNETTGIISSGDMTAPFRNRVDRRRRRTAQACDPIFGRAEF